MSPVIVVDQVTKVFRLQYGTSLKHMLRKRLRGLETSNSFLALEDVSFTVEAGESVGLMGLNGSGKSTLLSLVSGIMHPDAGRVLTRGRIAGLIGAGAGFHAQLSGRENIKLNGAILGMTEAEIKRKFADIIDFAGIGKFLDTEVGHYSSGMQSRLGFAVAIHTDCDIFLIDETLAVGDRPFKRKCLKRIDDLRAEGHTIVFVSHNTNQVKRLCTRALVLEQGKLAFDGPVPDAISYLHYDEDDDPDAGEL